MPQLLRRSTDAFKVRGAARDATLDSLRVAPIHRSIQDGLRAAEAEYNGLKQRMVDVLSVAAVTFGNDSDEYLSRDALDSRHQDLFSKEIESGERRLKQLSTIIAHLNFMKTELESRFPELDLSAKS